jgi:hypothetical protein
MEPEPEPEPALAALQSVLLAVLAMFAGWWWTKFREWW